ncbi:fibronectin type III domain-containing protein [Candidatus Lucifugimonas marina]|uniref:Fibronectin type-III domain-containing protein n=1 Tax=Candidatus Lucifugimonas marina TaxID=3038979 RepID=A0AAJ5ZG13_9CHLR|nr:hypothetical protein [SAR202 cluster bacterium JH702]MDG0869413.1 hypothetical protein [SAR202 cluster bacterium JH639]WFG34159.1 hypothetical protein GKN94_00140 [SAR202 cluster bacterium JH545]WFG38086.1 hypothetical protein GKO48_00140 [SAR202 cluster bacterium JH1073]
MNFSRSTSEIDSATTPGTLAAVTGTRNPLSNRFIAAMLATFAALLILLLGSSQWASADSGSTAPDPDPPPTSTLGEPRFVTAKPGDESAAVAWVKPAPGEDEISVDGYIVTANPSGITAETTSDDTLVIVKGLENGVEYTFTVVAFNENGQGAVSEPSNPVTPEAGIELNEEQLERLRAHLRKLAHEARERLEKAKVRAREQLEKNQTRIGEWLTKHNDRANEHLNKITDKANRQNEHKSEKARDWYSKLQEQLAKHLERAEGTERYEELRARAAEKLEDAGEKLADRLEKSQEQTDRRVAKAEEQTQKRIDRAEERAENSLGRAEERITRNVERMQGRLHDLLQRLRNLWIERAANQS